MNDLSKNLGERPTIRPTASRLRDRELNAKRAARAREVVKLYADLLHAEPDEPSEILLTDLLADLAHLAREEGLSIAVLAERAQGHYRAEIREDGS